MLSEPNKAPERAELQRLGVLLLITLLSRVLLLPQTPFEVDSVLLMRGVVDFDPTAMRPHPPGYPGVVALGSLLPFSPGVSLRLVSALASVPLVLGTWGVARRLGASPLLAAALVAANPAAWLYGVTENAYALGAAGATCAAWAALVALDSPQERRPALVLGLVLGLTGAARPSLLMFLAPLALYAARRQLLALVAGALPITLGWLAWCGVASGGIDAYLGSVITQFTWIRQGQIPHWRLHQLHHLGVYMAQVVAGGLLLLPWLRRPGRPLVLLLWAGVPFAFHLLVYVAKPGYLLAYTPAIAVLLARGPSPALARSAAVMASALSFLLPRPINVEVDPTPKQAFSDKSWGERVASELSFLSMTSLHRTRLQDRSNRAYTALLNPLVRPGYTVVLWQDRWDAALAGHHLPGVRVVDSRTPTLSVPVEGTRLIVLSWAPLEGFTEARDAQGYGAWYRDLEVEDLPLTIGPLEARAAY